jgi:ferric-dicitrate binding protein FerR (iron transport regulator)
MTAPPPLNPLPPLCEMARLWVSMAADGEVSEVERAALEEHIDVCEDCTEWRALAEAVVLHVRTTPPSPVPAGLLPPLPVRRSRRRGFALRAGGLVAAASAAAVLGVAVAGWHSSPPVQAQSGVVRPSEIVVGWNTSDMLDGRPLPRPKAAPSRPAP